MSMLCETLASLLSNVIVAGASAGRVNDFVTNWMFWAITVAAEGGPWGVAGFPGPTARTAAPPASMAIPATVPTIAPAVEGRTRGRAEAIAATTMTEAATISAIAVAASAVSER